MQSRFEHNPRRTIVWTIPVLALIGLAALIGRSTWVPHRAASVERAPHASRPGELVIVSVGDTMLGDEALSTLDTKGWDYPFRRVRALTDGADLLLGNLEAPITRCDQRPTNGKKWSYRQQLRVAQQYADVGFDVFDLANNHSMDYGRAGLNDTLDALSSAGIQSFGAGPDASRANAGVILETAGVRIGLIGWMQPDRTQADAGAFAGPQEAGAAVWDDAAVEQRLAQMRRACDVLIVSMHWGKNYSPTTTLQKEMGRKLIRWGADIVNGHHPHIAQGIEVYCGRPIVYSLGNFVFGSPGRFDKFREPGYGLVATYVIRDRQVARVELDVIAVDNNNVHFQPTLVGQSEARPFLTALAAPFGTVLRWEGARAVIDMTAPLSATLPKARERDDGRWAP